jgi:hypothetical protein
MRMPRAFEDRLTCDLGCGSLTQHSNDMYSFRQFLIFSRRLSYLSLSSTSTFTLNVCALQKIYTKQLPTCSHLHILVPSVIPFCIDMRGKSLSLCCSAFLTKQGCKSSNDPLSFCLNWFLQSNYQDNQTCV